MFWVGRLRRDGGREPPKKKVEVEWPRRLFRSGIREILPVGGTSSREREIVVVRSSVAPGQRASVPFGPSATGVRRPSKRFPKRVFERISSMMGFTTCSKCCVRTVASSSSGDRPDGLLRMVWRHFSSHHSNLNRPVSTIVPLSRSHRNERAILVKLATFSSVDERGSSSLSSGSATSTCRNAFSAEVRFERVRFCNPTRNLQAVSDFHFQMGYTDGVITYSFGAK